MAGQIKATKERLIDIFGDPNIYDELKEKILDSIGVELNRGSFRDTHFNTNQKVFEQFVDLFIEDILNDCDFQESLKKLNKLNKVRNMEYTPREIYLFRRNHSKVGPVYKSSIKSIERKVRFGRNT